MDFYSDNEPWDFEKCKYPSWDDCMRYYMSRINKDKKVPQKTIIHQLACAIEKIWKSGDGCPKSVSRIRYQFETCVLATYQKCRRGDTVPRSRQKKPGTPAQAPARRSARSAACTTSGDQGTFCSTTRSPCPSSSLPSSHYTPACSIQEKGRKGKKGFLDDRTWT